MKFLKNTFRKLSKKRKKKWLLFKLKTAGVWSTNSIHSEKKTTKICTVHTYIWNISDGLQLKKEMSSKKN